MEFRTLRRDEIPSIWTLDRTEYVEAMYVVEDGELVERPVGKTFRGWPPGEDVVYGPILEDCHDRGGYFMGGFADGVLRAIVVLDGDWIGPGGKTLQLKFLHVDRAFRGKGLGKALFEMALDEARRRGAERLYISATENKNTVEFYKRRGAGLAREVDPDLYELEPDDIHMDMAIRS